MGRMIKKSGKDLTALFCAQDIHLIKHFENASEICRSKKYFSRVFGTSTVNTFIRKNLSLRCRYV